MLTSRVNRRLLLFLGISVVLLGCASEPDFMKLPVTEDPRPKFYLVSWRTPTDQDAFALFSSDRDMYRFLDGFETTAPHITFAALEARIRSLPKKCLVSWMSDFHNDIDPPRPALERRVRALTDRRAIDLRINHILTH